ncbi:MAG: MFS transporter [Dehalococcoidia bacterium]|jgi:MFS family permease
MESTIESSAQSQKTYKITNGQKASILIVLMILFIINYADRAILSVTLQNIKVSLGFSDTQLGAIQTAFQIMVGAVTIPLGILIDRWSRRKLAGIMALFWSVTTFLTGLCTNFISMLFVRAAVGLGEDGFTTIGSGWLSVAFSKSKRAMVNGIFGIGGTGGSALGMIVGGIIVTSTGMWQMPFFIFAIPGVIFGIWAFFLKDYKTPKKEGESLLSKQYFRDWLALFKIKSYVFTLLGQMCFGVMLTTVIGWLPAFMMRAYDLNAAQAGGIVGSAALIGILGSLGGGFIADIWYRRQKGARIYLMTIAQLLFAILVGTVIYLMGSIPIPLMSVLLMVLMLVVGICGTLIYSLTMDVTPVSHRYSSYGIVVTAFFVVGSIGPSIVGAISDALGGGADGIRAGFLWLLPVTLLAVIFYGINWRYYPKESQLVSDTVLAEK